MKKPRQPKPKRTCGDCARAKKKTGAWFCCAVGATVRPHFAACPSFEERR